MNVSFSVRPKNEELSNHQQTWQNGKLFSAFFFFFFFFQSLKKTISGWVMRQWRVNLGNTLRYYNHIITKPSHKLYLSGKIAQSFTFLPLAPLVRHNPENHLSGLLCNPIMVYNLSLERVAVSLCCLTARCFSYLNCTADLYLHVVVQHWCGWGTNQMPVWF